MRDTKIKSTDRDKKDRRLMAANTLAGDRARNWAGEDLGTVAAIMIDIWWGRVAYAARGKQTVRSAVERA
jgi:hypothetical protein